MELLELYQYIAALFLAAQQLADDNQRLKTDAAKAIADVQDEANEALKELAGIWRVHCNGIEADLKEAKLGRSLAGAQVNSLKKDIANVEADNAIEVDALKSELADETERYKQAVAESDEAVGWMNDAQKERDELRRQLQRIRAAFEQLRSAVHPANIVPGGGLISGGVLGGGIPYGNPHRAIALGAGGIHSYEDYQRQLGYPGGAAGWLSSLDGDG